MAIPESSPATHKIYREALADWLDIRFSLETSAIKFQKINDEHYATLEKIKQDKRIDENTRKRLLAEVRSEIRGIDNKLLYHREQLERMNNGLQGTGVCVVPIHRVLDRLD
ncbi:unnamed protein product [Tuber aestivum]|uniref:Uncharacterized protein n=1 Tax=Tuber aestivum TaxID=59557 RepID=A0A292PMX6_9PEZI|nr:unnamed protein product [Tuber aestivum]